MGREERESVEDKAVYQSDCIKKGAEGQGTVSPV